MYKRDVGILILSICAVYITLLNDGPIAFRKAWYMKFEEEGDHVDSLPEPITVDLNGDGKPEFLASVPGGKLVLAAPRKHGDGFAQALVLSEVSLMDLAEKKEGDDMVTVLAMASGSLSKQRHDLVRSPRRKVVAVVSDEGHLFLLDANLKLKWKNKIPFLKDDGVLEDVSVLITAHSQSEGDQGMVVVSAREVAFGSREDLDDEDDDEQLGDFLDEERGGMKHVAGREKNGRLEEVDSDPRTSSRHVSYYAFSGQHGHLVWKHDAGDFHKDLSTVAESGMATMYSHKAAVQLQEGVHYGERSCREYRESILSVLPHRWYDDMDTNLQLAHFHKHKKHRGAQKENLAAHGRGDKPGAVSPPSTHYQWGKHSQLKNKDSEQRQHRHSPPNVIVSHVEDGIEVVHLYSGRPVCRLPLQPHVLHADVNGDGIPDHVHVTGGLPDAERAETDVSKHQIGHEKISDCMTSVTSGIPPKMRLFNGTVCSPGAAGMSRAPIDIAPPIALPVPRKHGHYNHALLHQKMNVMFFNSRGEVTSFDHKGTKLWTASTGIWWKAPYPYTDHEWMDQDDESTNYENECVPTLAPLPLRRHAIPSAVLVAGEDKITILTEQGRELWSGTVPDSPKQPIVVADFNLDGYTDLILITETGMYGWAQVRSPGGMAISSLVGGLIVVMVVVLYTQQQVGLGEREGKGRSTDRVD